MLKLLLFVAFVWPIQAAMIVNASPEKPPLLEVLRRLLPIFAAYALPLVLGRLYYELSESSVGAWTVGFATAAVLLFVFYRLFESEGGEDLLSELSGRRDGYIAQEPMLSGRPQALLGAVVVVFVLALFALLSFSFAPE